MHTVRNRSGIKSVRHLEPTLPAPGRAAVVRRVSLHSFTAAARANATADRTEQPCIVQSGSPPPCESQTAALSLAGFCMFVFAAIALCASAVYVACNWLVSS